jgi:hypothetical protein
VIAGGFFFLFTIWSGKKIDVWWRNFKKKLRAAESKVLEPQ